MMTEFPLDPAHADTRFPGCQWNRVAKKGSVVVLGSVATGWHLSGKPEMRLFCMITDGVTIALGLD
jgi:hypothetical protein